MGSSNNSNHDENLLTREILDRLKSQGADIAHIKESLAGWAKVHEHLDSKLKEHEEELKPIVKAHHWTQVTMRLLTILGSLAALALASTKLRAEELIPPTGPRVGVRLAINSPVVRILMNDGRMCSGFVFAKNRVMTAAHCARNDKETGMVQFDSEKKTPFKVLKRGEAGSESDVEVLEVETGDCPTLHIATATKLPFIGLFYSYREDTGPIGFPASGYKLEKDGNDLFGVGIGWVFPGDSGSAIVNEENEVQGVVVQSEVYHPRFYFVRVEQIRALLTKP